MLAPGQIVLHNRGRPGGLVAACGGEAVDVTSAEAASQGDPSRFGADVDLERTTQTFEEKGSSDIAYVHLATCPSGWNGQPISLANIEGLRRLADAHGVPIALDASNLMENALWVTRTHGGEILTAARRIMRVAQTQELGGALDDAGIPIVNPPGSHAIFLDAKRFLPHLDQDEFPAQALAAAIYIETGVRTMERGNVSKGRNPATGENYRPALELVRCTIPRRVYTGSHIDYVVEGIKRLWERRDQISGLKLTYEPKVLRFFQSQFEPKTPWTF